MNKKDSKRHGYDTCEYMIVTFIWGAEKSHKSFNQDILCPKYKSR